MSRLLAVSVLAALLAACSSDAPTVGAQLTGPVAAARFMGITADRPGVLRPYVAVATQRGNELRILDPEDNKAVLGPTVVFSLSIPTEPHPFLLASASLGDGGADLLVAASTGSADVQMVVTWEEANRVPASGVVDLAEFTAPGAQVRALTETPVLGTDGLPVTGRARVLASLTDGQLAVIDYGRVEGGAIELLGVAVQDLGFEALDLAVSPDGTQLFAATQDPLTNTLGETVFGVAQLAMTPDPTQPWSSFGLDARAPTTLVAAAEVDERTDTGPDVFSGTRALRVYASLDRAACGPARVIDCGIVTLIPGQGLAPDPAGELPHRAPIRIPGIVLDLEVAYPPEVLKTDALCSSGSTARLLLAPRTGARCTTAAGFALSSNGNVYVLDLGRYQAPSENSVVRGETRARVHSADFFARVNYTGAVLGLWLDDEETPFVTTTQAGLASAVDFTPGYIPSDSLAIIWQGRLPGFELVPGVVGRSADGTVWAAAQVDSGRRDANGNPVWIGLGPQIDQPQLGVHAGDILEVVTTEDTSCTLDANGNFPETTIVGVLTRDTVWYPSGAVQLPDGGCWSSGLAAGQSKPVRFSIRTSGFVLTGASLGYLGRPVLDERFTLQWAPDDDADPEQTSIRRKVRRLYYPSDVRCTTETPCDNFEGGDPMVPGPALSFRLGLPSSTVAGTPIGRDAQIQFSSESGIEPMSRRPATAGGLPLGMAIVDRSAATAGDIGQRVYAVYGDDQVFVFGPGESQAQAITIR